MCRIQASIAMEQWQSRLDSIGTGAAATCLCTRCSAMSTHQDLTRKLHTRTPKRIKKNREGPCLWRISQGLQTRTPYEHPRRHFQTSTNADHLQGLNAKTSWRGLKQHLQKIFSQGPRRECPPDRQKGLAAAGRDQTRSRCRNLPRACQKSFHTSAQYKHSWTAHKGTFMREFTHAAGQME